MQLGDVTHVTHMHSCLVAAPFPRSLLDAGIKGVWSLRPSWTNSYDSHLVLSFAGETRVLGIGKDDLLHDAVIDGFDARSQTLLAATTLHDEKLQVCCGHWVERGWGGGPQDGVRAGMSCAGLVIGTSKHNWQGCVHTHSHGEGRMEALSLG
jgi:hypothetical protein